MVRGGRGLLQGATGGSSPNRRSNGGRGGNRRSAISTILKKQEVLQGQIRALAQQQRSKGVTVRKDVANRKRTQPQRYFSTSQSTRNLGGRTRSTNMSINRTGYRRGRGGRGGAISSMNRKSSTTSNGGAGGTVRRGTANTARRGARGGSRGGRGRGRQPATTAADLDAQLDEYMGEDVRKARMDTELDAYFNRSGTDETKLHLDETAGAAGKA